MAWWSECSFSYSQAYKSVDKRQHVLLHYSSHCSRFSYSRTTLYIWWSKIPFRHLRSWTGVSASLNLINVKNVHCLVKHIWDAVYYVWVLYMNIWGVYLSLRALRRQLVFSRRHRGATLDCLLHLMEMRGIDVMWLLITAAHRDPTCWYSIPPTNNVFLQLQAVLLQD